MATTINERLYIMENKQRIKERENQERLKEIKKIELKKQQEKEQKQYEKDLLIACSNDLKNSMETVFSRAIKQNGANEITLQAVTMQYYNIDTRNACIKEFAKTAEEQDFLEKNYDKILNNVISKYKNHIKYATMQQAIHPEQETKQKENLKTAGAVALGILKGIGTVIAVVFTGFIVFLSACLGSKPR